MKQRHNPKPRNGPSSAPPGTAATQRDKVSHIRSTTPKQVGTEKASVLGEAWTSMTWRVLQANVSFAQTLLKTWWAPPRGAWLPFDPAQFHLPGDLPTVPLKAQASPQSAGSASTIPTKGSGLLRRRASIQTGKRTGRVKGNG